MERESERERDHRKQVKISAATTLRPYRGTSPIRKRPLGPP